MKMTFNIETAPSFARRELAGVAACAYASDALPDLGFHDGEALDMSRYTGPRVKVMRALGVELPGLSAKKTERRPYPPGQHGQARKKLSDVRSHLVRAPLARAADVALARDG